MFLIISEENKKIIIEEIELEITKEEAKKRKNKAKEDAKKLKEAKKANKAKEKLLAKKTKKLQRRNTVDVVYLNTDKIESKEPVVEEVEVITENQIKYAEMLGVPVEELTNRKLYDFIDDWIGTPYELGGETKEGIDCSSFTQRIYTSVLNKYIERVASKQYYSKYSDKFTLISSLKEGDLVFFHGMSKSTKKSITHVGLYLHNNKFVHATSSKRTEGYNGVKISDLSDDYWSVRFQAGVRRLAE